MSSEIERLRAQFVAIYASIPSNLRNGIIAVVDEKPYTWDSAYFEIVGKKPAGNKILESLKMIKVLK